MGQRLASEPHDVPVSPGSWTTAGAAAPVFMLEPEAFLRTCREGASSGYRHFSQQRRTKCRCVVLLSSSERAAMGVRLSRRHGDDGLTVGLDDLGSLFLTLIIL